MIGNKENNKTYEKDGNSVARNPILESVTIRQNKQIPVHMPFTKEHDIYHVFSGIYKKFSPQGAAAMFRPSVRTDVRSQVVNSTLTTLLFC